MLKTYSESGRGYWKEGVSSIDPDGDCRPGEHGRIVVGCDLYNLAETGGVLATITEGYHKGAGHSGPYVIEKTKTTIGGMP